MHGLFFISWAMNMQHAVLCARTWTARKAEICLEPGSEEACPAAQMPNLCASLHAVLPACHGMLFSTCMPHGM